MSKSLAPSKKLLNSASYAFKTFLWEHIWTILLSRGWKREDHPKPNGGHQSYFLPPGVDYATFRNRTDFWDSRSLVLRRIRQVDKDLFSEGTRHAEKRCKEENLKMLALQKVQEQLNPPLTTRSSKSSNLRDQQGLKIVDFYRGKVSLKNALELAISAKCPLPGSGSNLESVPPTIVEALKRTASICLMPTIGVNHVDKFRNTALMYAASCNAVSAARLLLEWGADARLRSKVGTSAGTSPLQLAVQREHVEMTRLIANIGRSASSETEAVVSISTLLEDFPHVQNIPNANVKEELQRAAMRGNRDGIAICYDISNGQERIPIPAIDFHYAEGSANLAAATPTFPGFGDTDYAYKKGPTFSGAWSEKKCCSCEDCNDPKSHCACTPDRCQGAKKQFSDATGMLLSHSDKALKVCGRACGHPGCIRSLGPGVGNILRLLKTKQKGWALQSMMDIPQGTYICDYVGTPTGVNFDRIEDSEDGDHQMTYVLSVDRYGSSHRFSIDGHSESNVARYVNHSCNPNLMMRLLIEPGLPNDAHPRVAFFTKKKVYAFEELTWQYSKSSSGKIKCMCGEQNCRKWL